MNVSIVMTAEERLLAEHYAEAHALSLEDAFKKALFEKIAEEQIDIPNEVTASAIEEGRKLINAENADGYKDIEELRAALDV